MNNLTIYNIYILFDSLAATGGGGGGGGGHGGPGQPQRPANVSTRDLDSVSVLVHSVDQSLTRVGLGVLNSMLGPRVSPDAQTD